MIVKFAKILRVTGVGVLIFGVNRSRIGVGVSKRRLRTSLLIALLSLENSYAAMIDKLLEIKIVGHNLWLLQFEFRIILETLN